MGSWKDFLAMRSPGHQVRHFAAFVDQPDHRSVQTDSRARLAEPLGKQLPHLPRPPLRIVEPVNQCFHLMIVVFEERVTDGSCQRKAPRSEEHTSELQSPCNLVCRLLLEKKKIQ